MQIHISLDDGVPIYLQIVNQIKYLVASGRLVSGEQLPPVRKLAEQLLVNPNTVARAYRELESARVLSTRRGTGVYVCERCRIAAQSPGEEQNPQRANRHPFDRIETDEHRYRGCY